MNSAQLSLRHLGGLGLLGTGAAASEVLLLLALGVEPSVMQTLLLAAPTAVLIALIDFGLSEVNSSKH